MAYPKPDTEIDLSMGTVLRPGGPSTAAVNDLLVCTYNESHLCSGGRYNAHIEECRRMYEAKHDADAKGNNMVVCPYNRSHHVHWSVLDKHIQLCDGYYKWAMENQKEPYSMVVSYPRYNVQTAEAAVGEKTKTTAEEKESTGNIESQEEVDDCGNESDTSSTRAICFAVEHLDDDEIDELEEYKERQGGIFSSEMLEEIPFETHAEHEERFHEYLVTKGDELGSELLKDVELS